jgi:hypothetical protein
VQNQYVVLKSPVKIGDYDRVDSYSKSLVKGEEQLLVTRDCKFFLTDGNGGYLEFKTINSGITLDAVTQMVNNLNTSLKQNITDTNTDLSKSISDLNTKIENQLDLANNDIATLKETVTNLGLEFSSYVTQEEFDNLSATVTSTTELATHDNRDTLDKFSEDSDGNPLYNSKKIVADFDTSGIEAEIADLNNRSVIGSELDYGFYKITAGTITANTPVNFYKDKGNIDITNGIITLKAGRKYSVKAQMRLTNNTTSVYYISQDGTSIGSYGFDFVSDSSLAPVVSAIIECTTNSNISIICSANNTLDANCAIYTWFEVIEIGRTTIIDPAEDAKKIQFEYGLFYSNTDQSVNANTVLKFNAKAGGNMSLSSNGYVQLKAGKTYSIRSIFGSTKTYVDVLLWNVTDSVGIGLCGNNVSTTAAQPMAVAQYTPTKDCEITVKSRWVDAAGTVDAWNIFIEVEELAQPYYFNYYKDSISYDTLFTGNANAVGDYTLSADITKYKYLIAYAKTHNGTVDDTNAMSMIIDVETISSSGWYRLTQSNSSLGYWYTINLQFHTNTTFTVGDINVNSPWKNPRVCKIVGVGYNYDNPYQDIITTSPDAALTDMQVDSDITSIWNGVGL